MQKEDGQSKLMMPLIAPNYVAIYYVQHTYYVEV